MKQLLDFDDAGASDDELVKGVTVGDIRAWHDEQELHSAHYDRILSTWAECRKLLSEERARTDRILALMNAQKYENDVLSVGQIRRALSFSGEQEPPRCNHWPTQKRCGVCGMDNTSTPSRPEPQEEPIPPDTEAELLHSIKLLMAQCDQLRGEYQRGLDDAIRAIRAGRDDWSSGEDIGKITNALLGVAEGRIADLSRASSSVTSPELS